MWHEGALQPLGRRCVGLQGSRLPMIPVGDTVVLTSNLIKIDRPASQI
jgi:hypothetical protein